MKKFMLIGLTFLALAFAGCSEKSKKQDADGDNGRGAFKEQKSYIIVNSVKWPVTITSGDSSKKLDAEECAVVNEADFNSLKVVVAVGDVVDAVEAVGDVEAVDAVEAEQVTLCDNSVAVGSGGSAHEPVAGDTDETKVVADETEVAEATVEVAKCSTNNLQVTHSLFLSAFVIDSTGFASSINENAEDKAKCVNLVDAAADVVEKTDDEKAAEAAALALADAKAKAGDGSGTDTSAKDKDKDGTKTTSGE